MASLVGGVFASIENGPAKVTLGANVLGNTREGIEVEIEREWNPVQVDETGEGWQDAMMNSEGITVTLRFADHSIDLLNRIIDGSTKSTSGPDSKVSVGKSAGFRATTTASALRIHPIFFTTGDADKSRDLVIHKAFVESGPAYVYETAEVRVYEVTFRGLHDLSRTQGDTLFSIGTETVSLDVTPPTVSSTNPADAATGIAITASIIWTFDEALDVDTVNLGNFLLNEDGVGGVGGAVSYDAGTFEVTFTPTVSMSAAAAHTATATVGVTDEAGNALAANSVVNFTTA